MLAKLDGVLSKSVFPQDLLLTWFTIWYYNTVFGNIRTVDLHNTQLSFTRFLKGACWVAVRQHPCTIESHLQVAPQRDHRLQRVQHRARRVQDLVALTGAQRCILTRRQDVFNHVCFSALPLARRAFSSS